MSKGSSRQGARQPQRRGRQLQPQRRSRAWIWIVLGVVALGALVTALVLGGPGGTPASLGAVQRYSNLSRTHSEGPTTYAQTPPVGGAHSGVWQNCGVYDQPLRNEYAVHSLEHGAVWVTYRPDLPADQVTKLRELARGQSYVLLSPYPGLPQPIAASAWGLQLFVDNASDQGLADFIRTYQSGSQTPEPGAPCTGGNGLPLP
jgi:hypothetical protein